MVQESGVLYIASKPFEINEIVEEMPWNPWKKMKKCIVISGRGDSLQSNYEKIRFRVDFVLSAQNSLSREILIVA